jgi:hypothetical protein
MLMIPAELHDAVMALSPEDRGGIVRKSTKRCGARVRNAPEPDRPVHF